MNIYLLSSGILTTLMLIVHSILGEILIIGPIQSTQGLPLVRGSIDATRTTLRFTWHVTSVLGLGIAAILFWYAALSELSEGDTVVLRILAVTFFVSFLVALIGSKGRHLSWLVLLIVTALTWLGAS